MVQLDTADFAGLNARNLNAKCAGDHGDLLRCYCETKI